LRYYQALIELDNHVKYQGSKNIDYVIANLSHAVCTRNGYKGHSIRQRIRYGLHSHVYSKINLCPHCSSSNYYKADGFHLFGIDQYICNDCGCGFSKPRKV